MNRFLCLSSVLTVVYFGTITNAWSTPGYGGYGGGHCGPDGEDLFNEETFGGNGRTCRTCHSEETGTVSPADALERFLDDENDPLFVHDGSDDGLGNGVDRMLSDATVLVGITMAPNVRLANSTSRVAFVPRGIPTTLNTPALDPILMVDGRQPDLESQALGAIHDHTQNTIEPTADELEAIAEFELTDEFFSSSALRRYADGWSAPVLPNGRTASEIRGKRFFRDIPPDATGKDGLCATCHAGPMLNQTNPFVPVPVPPGTRFQTVLVSEFNAARNPVQTFIFTNPDGTETVVSSPDPGRSLITGIANDAGRGDNKNSFKIPSLWGVRNTAPYFHDNSSATLEAVVAHYAIFFSIVTDPDGPGPLPPFITLTTQDQADMVAYMRLLN